jgi:superoxide dismutase, Cu-Zn family
MIATPGTPKPMIKPVLAVAAALVAPVAFLTSCATNQSANQTTTSAPPPGAERLTAQLKRADGTAVANATFDFANGYATVTVETVAPHILSPGFHGLHVHAVGKCEANSVAPTGGPSGDFLSAGGHFQVPGHSTHPASGDLTSLEVRADGSAKLVTTTDAFTAADLLAGQKTALMIHEGPDNFANIPQRYTQNGTPGPDQETLATGDAGKRVACGVIDSVTATSTTTPATTPAAPVTTGETTTGSPTTTTSAPTSTTSGIATTTSPSTVTVTATPSTSTSPPTIPGQPGG